MVGMLGCWDTGMQDWQLDSQDDMAGVLGWGHGR